MRTIKTFAAAASFAIGLGAAFAAMAAAASGTSPIPAGAKSEPANPPGPLPQHKLLYTVMDWSPGSLNIPAATFTPIDSPISITCKPAGGCTIFAQTAMQMSTSANGNHWAICLYVDGAPMRSQCPYGGTINVADYLVVGHAMDSAQVTPGKHTVQTWIYLDSSAGTVFWHQSNYALSTP